MSIVFNFQEDYIKNTNLVQVNSVKNCHIKIVIDQALVYVGQ